VGQLFVAAGDDNGEVSSNDGGNGDDGGSGDDSGSSEEFDSVRLLDQVFASFAATGSTIISVP
jgi:hypothetical protein